MFHCMLVEAFVMGEHCMGILNLAKDKDWQVKVTMVGSADPPMGPTWCQSSLTMFIDYFY